MHGSRCLLRAYPALQTQLETPFSVLQTSAEVSELHVESSPTIQVSIRTGGMAGRLVNGRRIMFGRFGGDLEISPLSFAEIRQYFMNLSK